jgi:hypothetical protein
VCVCVCLCVFVCVCVFLCVCVCVCVCAPPPRVYVHVYAYLWFIFLNFVFSYRHQFFFQAIITALTHITHNNTNRNIHASFRFRVQSLRLQEKFRSYAFNMYAIIAMKHNIKNKS